MSIALIEKYFPNITDEQHQRFAMMQAVYAAWNAKINVVSRKDIERLMERHVLHSLAIAKYIRFTAGTRIVDVGTGGGFPGIPLAVMFPEVDFMLIDSIGKKVKVVEGVVEALGLTNVRAAQMRSEQLKEKFDFVVSRAVTAFPDFVRQTRHLVDKQPRNAVGNGILYLKGGDFRGETAPFGSACEVFELNDYFTEEFFETKRLIHLTV